MKPQIDRAPIRFYLEHRERIEEWAALRTEVDAYTKQLLNEIGAEMAADGAALYHETEVSYPAASFIDHIGRRKPPSRALVSDLVGEASQTFNDPIAPMGRGGEFGMVKPRKMTRFPSLYEQA